MEFSQLCHAIEQWDRCGKWYIQMFTFPYEFDFLHIFKSEWILVGDYPVPNMIGYIVDKKVVHI